MRTVLLTGLLLVAMLGIAQGQQCITPSCSFCKGVRDSEIGQRTMQECQIFCQEPTARNCHQCAAFSAYFSCMMSHCDHVCENYAAIEKPGLPSDPEHGHDHDHVHGHDHELSHENSRATAVPIFPAPEAVRMGQLLSGSARFAQLQLPHLHAHHHHHHDHMDGHEDEHEHEQLPDGYKPQSASDEMLPAGLLVQSPSGLLIDHEHSTPGRIVLNGAAVEWL